MQNGIFNNPKKFYGFVNSKRKSSGFPSSLSLGGKIASHDHDIADLFADFLNLPIRPVLKPVVIRIK